jgi:hypothetical protein
MMRDRAAPRVPRPARPRATLAALVLLGLAATASSPARAAPSEAEVLSRAVELRERGQDVEALALLAEAHARAPSPRIAAQLALVELAREQWLGAETHLTEALAATSDAWVRSNRSVLEPRLEAVRARLAWLQLGTTPDGVSVALDGKVLGVTPFAGPQRVLAGTRTLTLTRDGYRTIEKTIELAGKSTERLHLTLPPKTLVTMDLTAPGARMGSDPALDPREQPPEASKGRGAVFWLTAAGAVLSLTAGVIGVVAATQSQDATPGTVVGVAGLGVGTTLSALTIWQLFADDPPPQLPSAPKLPK